MAIIRHPQLQITRSLNLISFTPFAKLVIATPLPRENLSTKYSALVPRTPIMLPDLAIGLAVTFAILMGLLLAATCMVYCRTGRIEAVGNRRFDRLSTIHEEANEDVVGRASQQMHQAHQMV